MTTTHRTFVIVRTTQSDYQLMTELLERISNEVLFTEIISITPEYDNIGLTIEIAIGERAETEPIITPETIAFRERIQIHYEWEGESEGGFTVQLFRKGKLEQTKTELFKEAMSWLKKWHEDYKLPVEAYGKWLCTRVYEKTGINATYF